MLETAVRRRYKIDVEKAAETVNRLLDDPDPRIQARAATIATVMEGQNQKDEQHAEDRVDEGRNRVLDFIARTGATEVPGIVDGRPKTIVVSGDEQRPSAEASREDEGGKS